MSKHKHGQNLSTNHYILHSQLGFTLVELIVVITILAILGTIAIMAFSGYSKNARDSVRTTDISNIMKGVELYSLKVGSYPEPDEVAVYTGGTSSSIKQGKIGSLVTSNIGISGNPVDPLTQEKYVYSVFGNSKYYQIGGEKENEQTLLIDSAYAESGKIIVKGNYIFDPSLPSLIVVPSSVSGSGIFDPNVCFVVDGGVNTFDSCVEKKSEMILKTQDANLVGYWDMETLTGTMLKDLSGNGNDGITYSVTERDSVNIALSTYDSTGSIVGKGGLFLPTGNPATGKVINLGTGANLNLGNNGTFNVIIKTTGVGWWPSILAKGTSLSGELVNYNLGLGDLSDSRPWVAGKSSATLNGEGIGYVSFQKNITDNQYYFLSFSFDSNNSKFYIDGNLVLSKNIKNPNRSFSFNNPIIPTTIGGTYSLLGALSWFTGPAYVFLYNGIIDEVKIYNRALSDEEILQQAKIAGF